MKPQPPKHALKFFRWFCREDYLEELEGDLTEVFYKQYAASPSKARRKFTWSIMKYFRPGFIKSFKPNHNNSFAMYKNHLRISWRSLLRQKMYSVVKVGGLALGIAACFLISLFIIDELRYDRHYANYERIYRVVGVFNDNGNIAREVWFPAPFAPALKQDYPEVERSGRYNASALFGAGTAQVRRDGDIENSFEDGFAYFDQSLLEIFSLPMVYGNLVTALKEPGTIVITKRIAEKYFPGVDPTGKLLIVNDKDAEPYKIGGVVKDFPPTSHIQFDFLITMTGREFFEGEQNTWDASNYPTYVLLRPGTNPKALAEKMMKGIVEKYYLPAMLATGQMSEKDIREMMGHAHLELQPVTDIHLDSNVGDSLQHGDMRFIWLFGTIAIFILIIACVNFINLSTAKSANRAKEVGLRKVVGSFRGNIITQFLTESFLFSFLSCVIAIALSALLLPYFNMLSGKSIVFPWTEWQLIPILLIAILTVGILAGVYPSFYLSSFKPIQVLKGNLSLGSKSSSMRSTLVVFQFTTSIVLIVSTLIIHRQMDYILNKELGFEKDQVLLVQGAGTLGEQVNTFKKELLQLPQVKYTTVSDYLPIRNTKRNANSFWKEGRTKEDKGIGGQIWRVDHDYIQTMGMEIVEGRDFNVQMPTDSQAVIVNQTMAKKLGLKDPVGQRITNGWEIRNIIGVVKDFHFESLKENIHPLCLAIGNSPDIVAVKTSSNDMPGTLEAVTKVWKKLVPHQPFRYTFLDQRYAVMYDDVRRMERIFTSFAVFAILVACLGLFALSAYMVEQRGKEIGIRLVLGASVKSIFHLLTGNFIKLVVVSFVIATPLAWYVMQKWLEDYVYRTTIGLDVFILSGAIAILIALFTVSYQSVRAALMNPMEKLRSE